MHESVVYHARIALLVTVVTSGCYLHVIVDRFEQCAAVCNVCLSPLRTAELNKTMHIRSVRFVAATFKSHLN